MGMLLELGGGGGHIKNIGLQNRGDGPKDSLWMGSHLQIITIISDFLKISIFPKEYAH